MARAKIFLWLCLSFIAGITLRSWLTVSNFQAYIFFLFCLVVLIFTWQNKKVRIIALAGIFLFLGIWRFNLNLPVINENHITSFHDRSLSFTGIVKKEPDKRIDHFKLTIEEIKVNNNSVKGKVLVKANLYPEYHYGDKLEIYCELKQPGKFNDFDYDQYLARYDIYTVCYYPQIKLLTSNQGNWFYHRILAIKEKLQSIINQNLTEPQASFLSAMVLGERGNITPELRNSFSAAGVSHIIAISGLHITIIAGLLMNLMIFLYIGRKKGFYLATLSLILFIILIGAPASAIRAGIMGFLLLLGRQVGRLSQSLNALILAAAVMLLFNPLLLRSDTGWQLSFLAVLGIIYLKPYLEKIKQGRRDRWQIRDSLEMTLSAQAMTLPWIVYTFGQLSVIAPLTNILVLPILPFLMILGLLASLTGLIWLPLAKIIFWPVWFLLSYILKAVEMLNWLPFSSWQINFPIWLVIIIYLIIFIWLFRKRESI